MVARLWSNKCKHVALLKKYWTVFHIYLYDLYKFLLKFLTITGVLVNYGLIKTLLNSVQFFYHGEIQEEYLLSESF